MQTNVYQHGRVISDGHAYAKRVRTVYGYHHLIGVYVLILSRVWQQYLSDYHASVVVQSLPADLGDTWIP